MKLDLISREKLEHVARKILKYPLHDAEKDYFLAVVMQIIAESKLSETLVFKGGTAIYHCYLDQLRFSEDLDFTSLDQNISVTDLKNIFQSYDIFEVKKMYKSGATLKIERLKYTGILDTPNSIKFEVDKLQNVYLPFVKKNYKNAWGLEFEVNVMNPVEICAEKIRACNDRFRYRDFYDLYMMVSNLKININDAILLIPKKEIRKAITKDNVTRNFELALQEKADKSDTVVYKKDVSALDLKKFLDAIRLQSYEVNV